MPELYKKPQRRILNDYDKHILIWFYTSTFLQYNTRYENNKQFKRQV